MSRLALPGPCYITAQRPATSSTTWWRRLSLAAPDDVNSDSFRALRQRGFSRQEAHDALRETNNDLHAAFHVALRIRHKSHTGSPYLYSGCELCDQEKDKLQARRASLQARRESMPSTHGIEARKAEAVEQWRERQARIASPSPSCEKANDSSADCGQKCGDGRHVRWCCPQPHSNNNSYKGTV